MAEPRQQASGEVLAGSVSRLRRLTLFNVMQDLWAFIAGSLDLRSLLYSYFGDGEQSTEIVVTRADGTRVERRARG